MKPLLPRLKVKLTKSLRWLNYQQSVSLEGRRFVRPVLHGMLCRPSESWMAPLLRTMLRDADGCFVDVGVNLGQTLLELRAIDPARRYVGFEPNPACLYYLENLLRMNSLGDCHIIPVGLSTVDGIHSLELYSDNLAGSGASLVPGFRAAQVHATMHVPVMTFETVARTIDTGPVACIKVDVEGYELEVLESLRSVIVRDSPRIMIEVLPVYDEHSDRHSRQKELEALLESLSYRIFRVRKTSDGGYADLEPLSSFGVHSDLTKCDYVLAKEGSTGPWS